MPLWRKSVRLTFSDYLRMLGKVGMKAGYGTQHGAECGAEPQKWKNF